MNRETHAQLRARRLAEVSRKVREESMRVNAEFAAIEQDPDALCEGLDLVDESRALDLSSAPAKRR